MCCGVAAVLYGFALLDLAMASSSLQYGVRDPSDGRRVALCPHPHIGQPRVLGVPLISLGTAIGARVKFAWPRAVTSSNFH